jgi:hypothetical protein
MRKPLNAASDNALMWRLGQVAREAGDPARKDVGDLIDRGLILLRLLREKGFEVYEIAVSDDQSQSITEALHPGRKI